MKKKLAALGSIVGLLLGLVLVAGPVEANSTVPAGVEVTLRNTLQDPGEPEVSFPALFGLPDNTFDESGTVSDSDPEFPAALAQEGTPVGDISGLYEIDIAADRISFTMLPDAEDPFWVNVFGEFPAGKFDRYYFTFAQPHNIVSGRSNNSSVALRVDSPTVVVVEISEGYAMAPPLSFEIALTSGSGGELALTGDESSLLAIAGVTMIAAGAMLVARTRRIS